MPKNYRKYTKEEVLKAVQESVTWADVCRKLDRKPATGSQTHLKNVAIKFGIDFTHFVGKLKFKGTAFPEKQTDISVYLRNEVKISSDKLRKRLIREGIKEEKCEKCGLVEWLGERIPLELDHKDSNHQNNNLDNLQIVCPNCHTFDTRSRRKKNLGI